jgi:uncharacterized protein with HEPN domain
MLGAVKEIRDFTRGLDEIAFTADLRTRRAVERALEILAEAQKNVSEDVKTRHPEVPWRSLHDLGNFYRHTYFSVDTALVWQAATGTELDLMEKNAARRIAVRQYPLMLVRSYYRKDVAAKHPWLRVQHTALPA